MELAGVKDGSFYIDDDGESIDLEDVFIDMSTLWGVLNTQTSLCLDDTTDRVSLLEAVIEAADTGR